MTRPYLDFATAELIEARESLAALANGTHGTEEERAAIGELVVGLSFELAERVAALVRLNGPECFGAALESLAAGCGIAPASRPRRNGSSRTTPRVPTVGGPFMVKQRGRQTPPSLSFVGGKVVPR